MMKNISLLFLAFLIGTAAMCEKETEANIGDSAEIEDNSSASLQDDEWKRFGFETAIATIERKTLNPQMEIHTHIKLYIKDYGASEARIIKETQTVKMLGTMKNVSNSRTIMERDQLITIKDGKAIKMKNPARPLMDAYGKSSQQQKDKFAQDIHDAMNAETKKKGTATVAGKTCELTETVSDLNGMKTTIEQCMYKGFVLRAISDGMGVKTTEEVLEFEEGAHIPAHVFEVEKGIEVREMPNMPGVPKF